MQPGGYRVFLFPSVSHVLKAEKILIRAAIPYKVIPVPRQISSDCGVCLRVAATHQEAVTQALAGQVGWNQAVPLPE
jgi:hypothetical protein